MKKVIIIKPKTSPLSLYVSENADGLCCVLTQPCPKLEPVLSDLSRETRDKWEIPREQLKFVRKLGHGQFGEVHQGKQPTWGPFD
jgi:fyn-related kinase